MAWSSALISGDEDTWFDDDKPAILANNVLHDAASVYWSRTNDYTAGDETDSDFPAERCYDGLTDLTCRGDSALSGTDWYLYIKTATGTDTDVDYVAIVGHNFQSEPATQLNVEIRTSGGSTTSLSTITTFPATDQRLVILSLDHIGSGRRRYTLDGANEVLRIKVVAGGNWIPQVGEVYAGQILQLKCEAEGAWDPNNIMASVSDAVTLSGARTRYVWHKGARKISAAISPHETARVTDIEDFFQTDTAYGTRPFFWVQEPASDPTNAPLVYLDNPELAGPYGRGLTRRNFVLAATEQGPLYSAESK